MPKTASRQSAIESEIMTRSGGNTWIGLEYLGQLGVYRWLDGADVGWTYWRDDQPPQTAGQSNQQVCVQIVISQGYRWIDKPCQNAERFL